MAPKPRARFQKRSDHCEKVIGSLISRQLTISRSDRIPRTILLRSDHDPGRSCSLRGSVLDQKISSQQLVILSVISPQLKSTNYRETLTGTWSVLCQQFVYFQWRYSHTHTCQIWHVQSVLHRDQTPCAATELAMTLSYRHSWMTSPHLPLWRHE